MVALQQEPVAPQGGWQSIRQVIFGQQRQRDAEDHLLAILTQIQTQLDHVKRGKAGPVDDPKARTSALRALEQSVNSVVGWHRDQLQSATIAGCWDEPLPDLVPSLLAEVQRIYPLFECAQIADGKLDCRDLVDSVGQLRGLESDAFFAEVLSGLAKFLRDAYARLIQDEPTGPVALTLQSTWDELIAEIETLRRASPLPSAGEARALTSPHITRIVKWTQPYAVEDPPLAHETDPELPLLHLQEKEPAGQVVDLRPIIAAPFRRLELVAC
jgi:hypothetical protein